MSCSKQTDVTKQLIGLLVYFCILEVSFKNLYKVITLNIRREPKKKKMMLVLGSIISLCIATCPTSNLAFVGDSRNFKVDQMCKNEKSVPSVEGVLSPTDFYDYYSASSHTGFEVPGRSFVFLYRFVLYSIFLI